MSSTLHPVTKSDFAAILDFEHRNRAYFEKWVPPRPKWYFESDDTYYDQMHALLKDQNQGLFFMYILRNTSNEITGRFNLSIDNSTPSTASLGYRLAKSQTGKGLATQAVKQLCSMARERHRLHIITALAALNNIASIRVLEKSGFVRDYGNPVQTELHGQQLTLNRFSKALRN